MTSEQMPPEQYLLEMATQNLEYCRHYENQRQGVANSAIPLAAILLAVVAIDQAITQLDSIPSLFIMIIGLHGILMSLRYEERFDFHYSRFRILRDELDEKLNVSVQAMNQVADREHFDEFPWVSKLKLRYLWSGLHAMIIVMGATLFAVSIMTAK
jgi:hypothetical protein